MLRPSHRWVGNVPEQLTTSGTCHGQKSLQYTLAAKHTQHAEVESTGNYCWWVTLKLCDNTELCLLLPSNKEQIRCHPAQFWAVYGFPRHLGHRNSYFLKICRAEVKTKSVLECRKNFCPLPEVVLIFLIDRSSQNCVVFLSCSSNKYVHYN